jgi:uncharacterized protein YndB with AHSA1/START domain
MFPTGRRSEKQPRLRAKPATGALSRRPWTFLSLSLLVLTLRRHYQGSPPAVDPSRIACTTRKYVAHVLTSALSDLRVGSTIEYILTHPDGRREPAITGKVLEVVPLRRLVHTFSFPPTGDEPTRVTYELEPVGELVKLTLTHEGFEGETKTYQGIRTGWAPIFDGLKTLLETGKPLGMKME